MNKRIIGLDLIRFISFMAITVHHFNWVVWTEIGVPSHVLVVDWITVIARSTEFYARSLAFSGFTIVFLASLLLGLSKQAISKRVWLFSFLMAGWVVFSFLSWFDTNYFYMIWDVYPLLFTGMITILFADLLGKSALRTLGLVGYLMLTIPFWHFDLLSTASLDIQHIFVGNCESDLADWPIFPWIGLVWAGYAVGKEIKNYFDQNDTKSINFRKKELFFWVPLLIAGVFTWGEYYNTPLGHHFACYTFRRPPFMFWGHFIWVIFLIRISFDSKVQSKLQSFAPTAWVSTLAISHHFWLAYIMHYALAYLLRFILDVTGIEAMKYGIYLTLVIYLSYFFLVELVPRWTMAGAKKVIKNKLFFRS